MKTKAKLAAALTAIGTAGASPRSRPPRRLRAALPPIRAPWSCSGTRARPALDRSRDIRSATHLRTRGPRGRTRRSRASTRGSWPGIPPSEGTTSTSPRAARRSKSSPGRCRGRSRSSRSHSSCSSRSWTTTSSATAATKAATPTSGRPRRRARTACERPAEGADPGCRSAGDVGIVRQRRPVARNRGSPDACGEGSVLDLRARTGLVVPEHLAYVKKISNGYHAQLAAACARVSTCRYDGGAARRIALTAQDLGVRLDHLSVRGNAKLASAIWSASTSDKGAGHEQSQSLRSRRPRAGRRGSGPRWRMRRAPARTGRSSTRTSRVSGSSTPTARASAVSPT